MKLEEAIKHKSFNDEIEKLIVNIAYTNSLIQSAFNDALKSHGVSLQQFNVLRILNGQHPKPIRINDIADRMVDKMSNASRLVDKLIDKGYVSKNCCEKDRRQMLVSLSHNGMKELREMNISAQKALSTFNGIGEAKAKKANELLELLRND